MKVYQKRRFYRRLHKVGLTLAALVPALVILLIWVVIIGVDKSIADATPLQSTQSVEQSITKDVQFEDKQVEDEIIDHAKCSLDTMYYLSNLVTRRDLLYPSIDVVVLYVDGEALLTVKDRAVADRIVEHLKTYQGDASKVTSVELEQDVFFKEKHIAVAQFEGCSDFDGAVEYIQNGGIEVVTYTIAKGDTLSEIASQYDSSVERLIADNPYLASKKYLTIGDQLVINRPEPLITQYVTVLESRVEQLAPSEEYIDNEALYIGEKQLVSEGKPGEMFLTEEVVYRNGRAVDRVVQSEEILAEAVDDIYQRGVKPLPVQLAESTLVRPVTAYRVTSRFGPRAHLGYHYGIDLKMPIGTPVYASEAGVIKTAGYRGGYGNLVVIDHGAGLETYYAHNSQLLVCAGEYVEKGQKICLSGNSGNSTGPHLHFEIKLNNVSVNPEKYLPF